MQPHEFYNNSTSVTHFDVSCDRTGLIDVETIAEEKTG